MSYNLLAYLEDCKTKSISPDKAVYDACCSVDVARLKLLKLRIEQVRNLKIVGGSKKAKAAKGRRSAHLGRLLERLMLQLLKGCNVLTVGTNVRSTMAEIDYLIGIGPTASAIFPMFAGMGAHSIGEAKCVAGGLKIEWLNELAGLLPAHGAKLGILFTAAPSKKLEVGARTTLTVHAAKGVTIVPFGFKQVKKVEDGESFLRVLEEQFSQVTSSSTELAI